MQKQIKLAATFILLIFFMMGTNRWRGLLLDSMRTYRSFLANTPLFPGDPLKPQTPQLVLVVIGGGGFEAIQAANLPALERLRESGASALMSSQPPSYAHPTWLTLISGVHPALNNGLLFETNPEDIPPLTLNTIFHNAQQQGLGTALVGPVIWRAVIPADLLTKSVFTLFEDAQGDQQIADNLPAILDDEQLNFVLIYFNQVDYAGHHLGGVESEAYEAALEQVDAHLNTLLGMLDLNRTTLIIAADHGHIERGGHGGHDLAVLRQPFIMAGKGVIPGAYSPIEQVDIAPTIAALLGLSLPAANQGRPLTAMIQLSAEDRAQTMVALAQQQLLLSETYLNALNVSPPDLSEIDRVRGFLANKNFAGATQLAELLIEEAAQTTEGAKAARLAQERRPRLLLIVGVLVGLLGFTLWQRTELWLQALLTAVVVIAAYHGLYRLAGYPYSFSAITNLENIGNEIGQRIALSLLAGSFFFIALLPLQQYTNIFGILRSSYEVVFFVALGFLLPALYGFWQYGLTITWFFPHIGLLFVHLTGLIQGFYALLFGLVFPVVVIPINFLIQKWISAYQRRQIMKLQTKSTDS